ncbi:hypothetical protein SAMN05421665_0465 [Yoonia rosea]|uniref:Uncharacterized protein n=1 Tax=Yoonia rosea TaxID=287098 RepID=A0A1R3WG64_9RHOB|nr:hypothetical protein [Yoonia rosea]SIT76925.1 hypothetical protein SAMN05421665_0465 [Yoonia rosea]
MSGETIVILLLVLIAVGGMLLMVFGDKRRKNAPTQDKGSNPGQGYHLIQPNASSGRDMSSSAYRVPKDPNDYAKIFAQTRTDKK